MAKKLTRREFLRLSAIAGAGAVLASCAPPTPTPAPPTAAPPPTTAPTAVPPTAVPKPAPTATPVPPTATPKPTPVNLRFAWWGGQARADITTKVIKMFEEKNPNIKFTYEFFGWDDYWTKMKTQAAGGSLPDVMQMDTTQLAEWTRKGLIAPLDDYIKSGVVDFSNVPKTLQDHGLVDGKVCAVSLGSNAIAFALDLDAFKKAGIDVPPDTWTWDDFEKIALDLSKKLGIWGFGHHLHHWDIWQAIYLGLGMQLYAPDGKSLGYTDDQPMIDHLKMILRLQDAKAIPTMAEEAEVKGPETNFSVKGRSAMDWMAGSNLLVALWTAAGANRNFKLLPVPRAKGKKQGTWIRPSQFIVVTKHSKNPKEAAMFVDFMTNSVEANKILNAERGVPINSVVLKELTAIAGAPQKAIFDYLARLATDSAPLPPLAPPGAESVINNVYIPEFIEPVRYKRITPEQGAAIFRERANKILAGK